MSTREQPRGRSGIVRADPHEAIVSPLELFFDLVFVFALTQVTAFLAEDPTFAQLGRGMLILAIIWWAWSGYTWLTSTVDPELGLPRLVMFAAMGAMLIVALATPDAFGDDGLLWGWATSRCACCTPRCSPSPRAATRSSRGPCCRSCGR